MSALQNQYWTCYNFYTEYKTRFFHKDIQTWEIKNNYYFNFIPAELADIKSELKCLLLADIKKKYQKRVEISHPRNYVLAVCKNDLIDILRKTTNNRKNRTHYENKWKVKMIDAKNRKNENLLVTLDEISYGEIRELFKSVLDIREMVVVYLVHSGFTYDTIAETLKISADYCRKIYNKAEKKLMSVLCHRMPL